MTEATQNRLWGVVLVGNIIGIIVLIPICGYIWWAIWDDWWR
jgi:hypothetical protein